MAGQALELTPAQTKGTAVAPVPDDIAAALDVNTNFELFQKLTELRSAVGQRPLAAGDIPTNRVIALRLHRMARGMLLRAQLPTAYLIRDPSAT